MALVGQKFTSERPRGCRGDSGKVSAPSAPRSGVPRDEAGAELG